jgi:hypothetical protein
MEAEERKQIVEKIRKEKEEAEKAKASQELKIVISTTTKSESSSTAETSNESTKSSSDEEAVEVVMQPTPPESVSDSWEKASADCAEATENVKEQTQWLLIGDGDDGSVTDTSFDSEAQSDRLVPSPVVDQEQEQALTFIPPASKQLVLASTGNYIWLYAFLYRLIFMTLGLHY